MKLQESLYLLIAGRLSSGWSPSGEDVESGCPAESDILAYREGKLWKGPRRLLESHFASCPECRELIVLGVAEASDDCGQAVASPARSLPEDAVRVQASKVVEMIARDERVRAAREAQIAPGRRGFVLTYGRMAAAAVLVLAIAVSVLVLNWMRGNSPEKQAMDAIAAAMQIRRPLPRISGGFAWSPEGVTRGEQGSPEWQLERARRKMQSAEDKSAPASERLVLARAYLASGQRADANRALQILREIAAGGVETPEVLNDTGVALYELGQYREAIATFTRVLEAAPSFNEALYNRALAEERIELYGDARSDWERFIRAAPDGGWKDDARRRLDALKSSSRNADDQINLESL